jgi:hypothetical protein
VRRIASWGIISALTAWTLPASAGDFDAQGNFRHDPSAVATIDFAKFEAAADYYTPMNNPMGCAPGYKIVDGTNALSKSGKIAQVNVKNVDNGCADRFLLHGVPAKKASYRATLWARHGGLDAQITVNYTGSGSTTTTAFAKLAPTGRTTSDGWVELASNEFPVDGTKIAQIYFKVFDFDAVGTDIDGLELVPAGEYVAPPACSGAFDPVCGPEAVCQYGQCQLGRSYVPPLPDAAIRGDVVDRMAAQLNIFFGGRKTRLSDLPDALARIEALRNATTAWQFWNGWANAIRHLHDWHTHADGAIQFLGGTRRLSACFIAGAADTTQPIFPSDPSYDDVLVSHVGTGTVASPNTLGQGDRLLAVDGQHPIAWALALKEIDWGWWQACDDRGFSEALERMDDLIAKYATSITFLSCDKATGTCNPVPKTVKVADLPPVMGFLACDNRPYYYYESGNPNANHSVGFKFFQGKIAGTTAEEKIFGLMWDTLYGGGDPNGTVNSNLKKAYATFKTSARGVILDHRAGNGGTLDAAEVATTLMQPPHKALVFRSPIDNASSDGPASAAAGIAIFNKFKSSSAYDVGAADYDPKLPVALILHRDGSASDFFPFGVKGAPNARIFGTGPTAGAFSTFYTFAPWGPISFQFASGDSISAAGQPLIGHGVDPDEIVKQKQSDLLAGRDSMVEAALAWLRTRLK